MFTIGHLVLYTGIIACLNVFCSCQGSTGIASSGYHSFFVQSRSGIGLTDIECKDVVKKDDIKKIILNTTESAHADCFCYLLLEEQEYEKTDKNTTIWTIQRLGADTKRVERNWFSDHDDASRSYRFAFNITSEGTDTTLTFYTPDDEQIKITPEKPIIFFYNTGSIFLDLECHSSDTTTMNVKTRTPLLTSSGHLSSDKTTLSVITVPLMNHSSSDAKVTDFKDKTTLSATTEFLMSHSNTDAKMMDSTVAHQPEASSTINRQSTSDMGVDQSTASATGEKSDNNSQKFLVIIISAVAGGLIFVVILIITIVCVIKRKRGHRDSQKRPGSSPSVLYSNLSQTEASRQREGKPPLSCNLTEDEQLPNQSEMVGTTYADIDPKSLVPKDKLKTDGIPGAEAGNEPVLTYADFDWAANGKKTEVQTDPIDALCAKPNKMHSERAKRSTPCDQSIK